MRTVALLYTAISFGFGSWIALSCGLEVSIYVGIVLVLPLILWSKLSLRDRRSNRQEIAFLTPVTLFTVFATSTITMRLI